MPQITLQVTMIIHLYLTLINSREIFINSWFCNDNVHVQNTMRMVEALIQANKRLVDDLSDKNHGIYGGNTRLHLYNKMTNFLNDNLKTNSILNKSNLTCLQLIHIIKKKNFSGIL